MKEYEAIQPDKIAVDGGEQNLKVKKFELLPLQFREYFIYLPGGLTKLQLAVASEDLKLITWRP